MKILDQPWRELAKVDKEKLNNKEFRNGKKRKISNIINLMILEKRLLRGYHRDGKISAL